MYSYQIPEDKKDMYAVASVEDVEASYKDLTQVCGRIRNKDVSRAISFLEAAAGGEVPVLYKKFKKRCGHRKELCGAQGRYPLKAAGAVLKAVKSAVANSAVKGLSEDLIVVHAAANCKHSYPRIAPKGRRFRQDYSTSRIEIVVKEKVETPPEKRKERVDKIRKAKAPKAEAETKKETEKKHETTTKSGTEAKPATEKEIKASVETAPKSNAEAETKTEKKKNTKKSAISTDDSKKETKNNGTE